MKNSYPFFSKARLGFLAVASTVGLSLPAAAAPAQPISYFSVISVASANNNPTLPTGLTPDNALTLLHWESDYTGNQYKTTKFEHDGGWLAFATQTVGYVLNGHPPTATYSTAPLTYFGQHVVVDSAHNGTGFIDEWYCGCNPGGVFHAETTSIINSRVWWGQEYVAVVK